MITASCLCGGVRYEIDGQIGPALNCHCSMCRKMTGAAFRSRVAIPSENFHWIKGEGLLTHYVSSPATVRTFCRVCGSTLVSLFNDNPKTLGLASELHVACHGTKSSDLASIVLCSAHQRPGENER
jgi:hypothetical protein